MELEPNCQALLRDRFMNGWRQTGVDRRGDLWSVALVYEPVR